MELSLRRAYDIMFKMLDKYYWMTKHDWLGALLGVMNVELWSDNEPIDPAILINWEEAVLKVVDKKRITSKEGFKAMIIFLERYNDEFGFEIKEIIEKIKVAFSEFEEEWENINNQET